MPSIVKHSPYVGVSSCLLGEMVRYDGSHKRNRTVRELAAEGLHFIPFCPEVEIGLGVPREPIQLVQTAAGTRCLGTKTKTLDVTESLNNLATQQRWADSLSGYIFKARSPSCGLSDVPILRGRNRANNGQGLFAARIKQTYPALPIADENQLENLEFRQDFIVRIQVYHQQQFGV